MLCCLLWTFNCCLLSFVTDAIKTIHFDLLDHLVSRQHFILNTFIFEGGESGKRLKHGC